LQLDDLKCLEITDLSWASEVTSRWERRTSIVYLWRSLLLETLQLPRLLVAIQIREVGGLSKKQN
jgi:hypothetical protein